MNPNAPRAGDRGYAAELFGSLGSPPAEPRRVYLIALWSLVLVGLLVVLPTGLNHVVRWPEGHQPAAARLLMQVWLVFAGCFVAGSVAAIVRRGEGPVARVGVYAIIAGLLATNQITMLQTSTMASWGTLYIAATIAAYRVALDYRAGLFATVLGCAFLGLAVWVEWVGLVPLAPFSTVPIVDPRYEEPGLLLAIVVIADATLVLTFMSVNFGMNQTHKLHLWITRSVLARYLPPSLVERAAAGELVLDGPPERRVVTVLFTDLVGFTAMTERIGAERLAEVLNRYLTEMSLLAHAHGATVDKFVGDAMMLVFGAPEEMPPEEQARRALALARAMVERAASLPEEPLALRAGIETGEGVVGNFGSATRSDYTVLGRVVNLASRLEAAAGPGRIYVGPGAAALVDPAELVAVGPLSLKGFDEPVHVWQCAATPASR